MDEAKSERNLEQTPLTPGKKILWIVGPEKEEQISGDPVKKYTVAVHGLTKAQADEIKKKYPDASVTEE